MAIEVTTIPAGPFIPNGVTTDFPFDFKIPSASEIRVYALSGIDEADFSSALYSVTISSDGEGGTVSFALPPAEGIGDIYIEPAPTFKQTTRFNNNGFLPATLNPVLDRLGVGILWLRERVLRVPTLPRNIADYLGQFPVILPGGTWGFSTGTGVDAGLRTDLAGGAGPGFLGFLWDAATATSRSLLAKLRGLPPHPEDFGALGNYNVDTEVGTDDRMAFRKMSQAVAALGGGKTLASYGRKYRLNGPLTLLEGVDLDLNRSELHIYLGDSSVPDIDNPDTGQSLTAGVHLLSHAHIRNGTVIVHSTLTDGEISSQAGSHACIQIGPFYSQSEDGVPHVSEGAHDWSVRNMTVYTDKRIWGDTNTFNASIAGNTMEVLDVTGGSLVPGMRVVGPSVADDTFITDDVDGNGLEGTYLVSVSQTVAAEDMIGSVPLGAVGIQVLGGAHNGVIDNITVPDNDRMTGVVHMDWAFVGDIRSSPAWMWQNYFQFIDGTGYTTHPHNIEVGTLKIGRMDNPMLGQDTGSWAVRLSGCYNIREFGIRVGAVTNSAVTHTAGDLGFEFSKERTLDLDGNEVLRDIRHLACRNIVYSDIAVEDCGSANLLLSDTRPDNIGRAADYVDTNFNGAIAGDVLTVTDSTLGEVEPGLLLESVNVDPRTIILEQLTSTEGGGAIKGNGTYRVSVSQTVVTEAMVGRAYVPMGELIYRTNMRVERVVGKGSGDAEADYGIRFQDQDGGTVVDCQAIGFKEGFNVDQRCRNIHIVRPVAEECWEHGINVGHATFRPDGIKVTDPISRNNAQGGGGHANIFVFDSDRTRVEGAKIGTLGEWDTALVGLYVTSGVTEFEGENNWVYSTRQVGGVAYHLTDSGSHHNRVALWNNNRAATANVTTRYEGTDITVVQQRSSPNGYALRVFSLSKSASKVGLTVRDGDIAWYTDAAATESPGWMATGAGTFDGGGGDAALFAEFPALGA